MILAFPDTVTHFVWDPTATDAHGNAIPAFTAGEDVTAAVWPGGRPGSAGRPVDGEAANNVLTEGLTLLLEGDVTVTALDEFEVLGLRYRVQGDPLEYRSPLTGTALTTVTLLRRA